MFVARVLTIGFHQTLYSTAPEVVVRSPGRAEIIGNHVDYCGGVVLAGAIAQATTVSVSLADDSSPMLVWSEGYAEAPVQLDVAQLRSGERYPLPESASWTDYVGAVVSELIRAEVQVPGFVMSVTSNVPSSGGVSSSASLELGVAKALCELAGHDMALEELALLCQRAEHSVGSNCGLLDQYAVALGEAGSLLKLDFSDDSSEIVKGNLGDNSFVVVFDAGLKRTLGDTGYAVRRTATEDGLAAINKLCDSAHESLRSVDLDWLVDNEDKVGGAIESTIDPATVFIRLRHVVSEMARVDLAIEALRANNPVSFGELLTQSGHSALKDYELDEDTPELTEIVEAGMLLPGVLGIRNMGGGFSSVSLALVENSQLEDFKRSLSASYSRKFGSELTFLEFEPSSGVEVISNCG